MNIRTLLIAIAGVFLSEPAFAQMCTSFPYTNVPGQIYNGSTADAGQVWQDFSYVGGCAAPTANPSFTGNVGIGTTSPATSLDVNGSTDIRGGSLSLLNGTSNILSFGTAGIAAPGSGSIGEKIQLYGTPGTITASDYAIGVQYLTMWFNTGADFQWDVGGTPYMTMTNSGNLGIGTTTPLTPLHVNGDITVGTGAATNYNIHTSTSAGSDTDGVIIGAGGSGSGANNSARGAYVSMLGNQVSIFGLYGDLILNSGQATSGSGGSISLRTDPTNNSSDSSVTRMFIANGGNVGIGTTGPIYRLQIVSAANGFGTGSALALDASDYASNGGYLALNKNSGTGTYAAIQSGDNTQYDVLALNPIAGNVGIGMTSPSYLLQANGQVAGNGAYVNTSDIRLKKEIRPIDDALALIDQIQGVRFAWRAPNDRAVGKSLNLPLTQPQVGFVAQSLQKVLPEAVSVASGPERIMSVAESKVVPVLVEAVKELQSRNDRLSSALRERDVQTERDEQENTALKAHLADEDRRLAIIEARLRVHDASVDPVATRTQPTHD